MEVLKTIKKWYTSPGSTKFIVASGLCLGLIGFGAMKLGEQSDYKSARTQKPHLTFPIKYDPVKMHFVFRPIRQDVEQHVYFKQKGNTLTARVRDADSLTDVSWQVNSIEPSGKGFKQTYLRNAGQRFGTPTSDFEFSESFDEIGRYSIEMESHDKKGNAYSERTQFIIK